MLAHLDRIGIDWGLGADAQLARSRAAEQFTRLENAATVHGDAHLRNILLRRPGDAHLIDYEGSGPGHPAIDLVRLELHLYLRAVRQVEPENQCIAFQRSLSIDFATEAQLADEFSAFHRCQVNVACARGCVRARDEAMGVLDTYGGDRKDYIATKYLVAWQNLLMPGSHTGLARVVLAALTPEILSW
jgi:aminoglycoside phosphotransferase (APT) family kinase protein